MSDLIDDFHTDIISQAKKALGGTLNGTLSALQLGSQGDFPWFWSDTNGAFNERTFNYISRRAAPTPNGSYALPDSFLTTYSGLLDKLSFSLSKADQAKLNAAQLKATVQAGTLVSNYEGNYGPITKADLADATKALGHPVQKIDYVIGYVVGYLWSGAKAADKPPLTQQQMAKAKHLEQILPNAYGNTAAVLPSLAMYLSMMNSVLSLVDASSNAQWLLGQVRGNLESPDAANGGMTSVDTQGQTSETVGYTLQKSPAQILADLTSGSALTIDMSASRTNSNQLQVNVGGHASTVVPISFLSIDVGGSAHYSMFQASGSGSTATIEMEFEGITTVGVAPTMFDVTSRKGWFNPQMLAEAFANGTKDVTGWQFSPATSIKPGPKGDFGMLTNMVISKFPKITITYTAGNYSQFSSVFQQDSHVGVSLFGIPLGGATSSVYKAHHAASTNAKGFTLTLNPPDASVNVAPLDQRAYVIGAVVDHPAASLMGGKTLAAVAEQASLRLLQNASFASTPPFADAVESNGTYNAETAEVADGEARAMVRLGGVTFSNSTGAPVEIVVGDGHGGRVVRVEGARTSPVLNGRLRTIDVLREDGRFSYDMVPFWPNGLLVSDESPYQLRQVLDHDGVTLLLLIRDNTGADVVEVHPAGVLH